MAKGKPRAGKTATQEVSGQQLGFDFEGLREKKFSLSALVRAKFNRLADRMDALSHADVVWLSRVEDFFFKNEYISERQVEVLDSIIKRHVV